RSRALRRSGGRRTPIWSDRSRALRRSGGRRTPRWSDRHDSGLRVNWYDRGHWVRHWIVLTGVTAGIGSPHQAVGSSQRAPGVIWQGSGLRVNWYDRRHWVRPLYGLAGQRAWVTRHQVIWLDSGHRIIWQGSGL
ncbi:unnamed protein product, partial [Staurois parvus]